MVTFNYLDHCHTTVLDKENINDDSDSSSSANNAVKTSWRLPKPLVKKIKQYALDHETTVTAVLIQSLEEFFSKKGRK